METGTLVGGGEWSTETLLPVLGGPVPKGLAAKLVEVQLDVESVRKQGRNETQKYNYVRAEDVAAAASKALLKRGLFCDFEFERADLIEVKTKAGSPAALVTVYGSLLVTDPETGESLRRSAVGSGHDTPGDKAILKAQTSARKYALIHLLGIPIGDDPEEDHGTGRSRREAMPPANPLDAERVEALRVLLRDSGLTYREINLTLGACGIDALRAHSPKAALERFRSLTDEQADALEAILKGGE